MTRGRVLEMAPGLLAQHGYKGTSVRELAEVTGSSTTALYHHFGSKDGLLAAVAGPFADDLDEILELEPEGDDDDDRVAVIEAYVLSLLRHRDMARVLLFDAAARGSSSGQRVLDLQRRLVSRLVGRRASIQRQVRVRCSLAIAQLAVGELASVPSHRLREPLLAAAVDSLIGAQPPGGELSSAAAWRSRCTAGPEGPGDPPDVIDLR